MQSKIVSILAVAAIKLIAVAIEEAIKGAYPPSTLLCLSIKW